jgi:hypothetical protein
MFELKTRTARSWPFYAFLWRIQSSCFAGQAKNQRPHLISISKQQWAIITIKAAPNWIKQLWVYEWSSRERTSTNTLCVRACSTSTEERDVSAFLLSAHAPVSFPFYVFSFNAAPLFKRRDDQTKFSLTRRVMDSQRFTNTCAPQKDSHRR